LYLAHVVGLLDQLRGELCCRPDQDRVELADPLRQFGVIHVDADLDVEVLLELINAAVGDLLLDEYLGPVAQLLPPVWPVPVNRLRSSLFTR